MLSCKKVTQLISESQDRELFLREKIPLKLHLTMCSGCKNFSLQIPFLSQAMRSFSEWDEEESKNK